MSKERPTASREMDKCIADLVVIGAGPHALSLLAKVVEPRVDPNEETPQNTTLFKKTRKDVIKARYDTEPSASSGNSLEKDLRRYESRAQRTRQRQRRQELLERCKVLDLNGKWMAQWHRQFESLNIPVLRSPISAHPDPIDREMLRLHAEKHKRRGVDTIDIDIDRSKSFHGPYEVPTTKLFEEFCDKVIARYELGGIVRQAKVTRIVPIVDKQNTATGRERASTFLEVHVCGKVPIIAKNVVVAVGSLNNPALPVWATAARENYVNIPEAMESLLHSNDIVAQSHDQPSVLTGSKRLLVVGGGLTAGHLALKALRSNEDLKVAIASRRNLVEPQFDLELKWMGMKRTNNLADFWSVDSMAERARILRQSKNGGSVFPAVLSDLFEFESGGRLELLENMEVVDAHWEDNGWMTTLHNGDQRYFDAIWCATGTITDFRSENLFQGCLDFADDRGVPIEVFEGFPVLTKDLRIHQDLNVFVMGTYAGLRLGPGALNLMGGSAAAARIANALGIALRGSCTQTTWQARSSQ